MSEAPPKNYNASTVPIIQLALSGEGLTEQNLADIGINQLRTPLVTVPGASRWLGDRKWPNIARSSLTRMVISTGRSSFYVPTMRPRKNTSGNSWTVMT
jgi:hypothetical protein